MNELIKLEEKGNITSLELLDQINFFREQEGNSTKLRHDTLLNIIRDEFKEEISLQYILESDYENERGKKYPMFILTFLQATQVLVRESRLVRKGVIKYIGALQEKLQLKEKEQLKLEYQEKIDEYKLLAGKDEIYRPPLSFKWIKECFRWNEWRCYEKLEDELMVASDELNLKYKYIGNSAHLGNVMLFHIDAYNAVAKKVEKGKTYHNLKRYKIIGSDINSYKLISDCDVYV